MEITFLQHFIYLAELGDDDDETVSCPDEESHHSLSNETSHEEDEAQDSLLNLTTVEEEEAPDEQMLTQEARKTFDNEFEKKKREVAEREADHSTVEPNIDSEDDDLKDFQGKCYIYGVHQVLHVSLPNY